MCMCVCECLWGCCVHVSLSVLCACVYMCLSTFSYGVQVHVCDCVWVFVCMHVLCTCVCVHVQKSCPSRRSGSAFLPHILELRIPWPGKLPLNLSVPSPPLRDPGVPWSLAPSPPTCRLWHLPLREVHSGPAQHPPLLQQRGPLLRPWSPGAHSLIVPQEFSHKCGIAASADRPPHWPPSRNPRSLWRQRGVWDRTVLEFSSPRPSQQQ